MINKATILIQVKHISLSGNYINYKICYFLLSEIQHFIANTQCFISQKGHFKYLSGKVNIRLSFYILSMNNLIFDIF